MATRATALRSIPSGRSARSPISRPQVEAVISRSVASFGAVFALQSVPQFLEQRDEAHPLWLAVVATAVFAVIIVVLVLSFLRRRVRQAHVLGALIYLVALGTWPLAVNDNVDVTVGQHWLYQLLTVATAMAAIGFSTRIATLYLLVVPAIYGIIRGTVPGGSAYWVQAMLESLYAVVLGGAIVVIVSMLRSAAASVDIAQSTALDRYSHAVRQHATEVERVQVDSIVHDSVLTTLLSAARAYTPEAKELAATMAGNAIGHLRAAALVGPDDGSTVSVTTVAERVAEAATALGHPFELRTRPLGTMTMPAQAADAVYSAAVQAMINSVQHAGQGVHVSRWLALRGAMDGGIIIEVGDTGSGFALVDVPTERLGLRVSIIERVANAGGFAEVDSVKNEGTVITIRWPRDTPRVRDLDISFDELGGTLS
jgi:signal transduction histidine kinase